jgi:hypothetical protein
MPAEGSGVKKLWGKDRRYTGHRTANTCRKPQQLKEKYKGHRTATIHVESLNNGSKEYKDKCQQHCRTTREPQASEASSSRKMEVEKKRTKHEK